MTLFVEAKRRTDGNGPLPGSNTRRIAEMDRRQAGGRNFDEGDVATLVDTDDLGRKFTPVGKPNRDFRRICYHVRVGQHVAIGRNDEARPDAVIGRLTLRIRASDDGKNCDNGSSPSSPAPPLRTFSVTLMFTTAAPLSATKTVKSGNPVTRAAAGADEVGTEAAGGAPAFPESACDRSCATTTTKMLATAASDQVLMLPIKNKPSSIRCATVA